MEEIKSMDFTETFGKHLLYYYQLNPLESWEISAPIKILAQDVTSDDAMTAKWAQILTMY